MKKQFGLMILGLVFATPAFSNDGSLGSNYCEQGKNLLTAKLQNPPSQDTIEKQAKELKVLRVLCDKNLKFVGLTNLDPAERSLLNGYALKNSTEVIYSVSYYETSQGIGRSLHQYAEEMLGITTRRFESALESRGKSSDEIDTREGQIQDLANQTLTAIRNKP